MNENRLRIAPSVLAADFARLGEELRLAERGGADLLHVDVMDAHFVPNLSFGPMIVDAINRLTDLHLSTHLMMSEPHRYLEQFAGAGSDAIIVHIEVYPDPRDILREIRGLGAQAGITLNPDTPIAKVEPYLSEVDVFLVMSVNPGFGGQEFMPEVLSKVTRAAELKRERGLDFAIHIDGGIDPETAPRAAAAGAEVLVAGSAVFKAEDPMARIAEIRRVAEAARD